MINRRRDDLQSDTERKLFDCALTIFAEKGYDATSVRDIIHAAGVKQPTLYYYCNDKKDLFLRLVRMKYEASLEQMKTVIDNTSGCREVLQKIMVSAFVGCAEDPRVARVMFQTAFGAPIDGISEVLDELGHRRFQLIRGVIRQGVSSGQLAKSSIDGLALAFCCLMDQHINLLARQPNPQKHLTPKLAAFLVELFFQGAAPS